jgi:hypothetical protein
VTSDHTATENDTMSQLQHARSFRDLIVHQKARSLAKRVFAITKRFPRVLNSMIDKAASFCGEPSFALHESAVNYFTTTDH